MSPCYARCVLGLLAGCRLGFSDVTSDAPQPASCVHQLSAYGDQICIVRDDARVYCWGAQTDGNLGNGLMTADLQPVPVASLISEVAQLASGEDTVCAIKTDGTLWCWGRGDQGQVGDGAGADRATPSQVSFSGDASAVTAIATSQDHTCARLADGTGWCWGDNEYDELGVDEASVAMELAPSSAPLTSTGAFSLGDYITCMIEPDATVQCFGRGTYGELGDGDTTDSWQPVQVGAIPDPIVSLSAGCDAHLCAATTTGEVWCWGTNNYEETGADCTTTTCFESLPVRVARPPGMAAAVEVTTGAYHSCARTSDGQVWCWGDDESGQLGNGAFAVAGGATHTATPVQVQGLTGTIVDLQASCGNTYVLRADETVLGWGDPDLLGTGEVAARAVPAAIPIPCD